MYSDRHGDSLKGGNSGNVKRHLLVVATQIFVVLLLAACGGRIHRSISVNEITDLPGGGTSTTVSNVGTLERIAN